MLKVNKKDEPEFFSEFKRKKNPKHWDILNKPENLHIKPELKSYMLKNEQKIGDKSYCPYCEMILSFEDNDLKEEFSKLCDEMGLSVSSAFTAFMKMTIRENAIPFPIKAKRLTNKDIDAAFKYLDSFKVCDKEETKKIIEILNNLSEEDKEISSSHVIEL